MDPKLIGNHRNIIISNQAGRSNILSRLEAYGVKIDSKDKKVQKILSNLISLNSLSNFQHEYSEERNKVRPYRTKNYCHNSRFGYMIN